MKREILSQQQSIAINMRAENVRNVEESQKNRDNQTTQIYEELMTNPIKLLPEISQRSCRSTRKIREGDE